jgi:hypothetical protein
MPSFRRPVLGLILVWIVSSQVTHPQDIGNRTSDVLPNSVRATADRITAARLKDYLHFIASDELEGRGTPSQGQDIAAKFITTHGAGKTFCSWRGSTENESASWGCFEKRSGVIVLRPLE